MEIKDLQPNQGNIDLVLKIKAKDEERSFEKFGKAGRVCKATAADDSGEVKLTLWNEDVDKVSVGDKIHLKNGWCSEYQGEKQISAGKFGTIEVLESAGTIDPEAEPEAVVSNSPEIVGSFNPEGQAEPAEEDLVQEEENIE